jgi:hypothetical protein
MLIKVVEQPLDIVKGYTKTAGKFPKATGQPLRNS